MTALAAALALLAATSGAARAQQQSAESRLRAEREKLDELRREREELERRRTSLQSTVHDLSDEVDNLNREAQVTERVVKQLDSQLITISTEIGHTSADLVRAQDEITVKRAILEHRLVDIYKRGPLYSYEVLLSAHSFGDLIARYKYLYLVALRDRNLVKRVEDLRAQVDKQRSNLVRFQESIEENRVEKADEERRLRGLQSEQSRSLADAKRQAKLTEQRLEDISRDEKKLADVITALENARIRADPAARSARGALRSSLGTLDWPVSGDLLYNYGRVVSPNNTTIRWNGIGIKASAGTEVRAVAAGHVLVADLFGTYGLTVIIQHPGGDYSVYGSLSRLNTQKGATVSKGQVIGYVGSADPDLPPHLHFELRPQGHAVDPLDYLRSAP